MSFETDFVRTFELYRRGVEAKIDRLLRSYDEARAQLVRNEIERMTDRLNSQAQKIAIGGTIDIYKTQARKTDIALELLGSTIKTLPDSSSGLASEKLKVSSRDSIKSLSKLFLRDILRASSGIKKNIDVLFYLMRKSFAKIASVQAWDMRDELTISNLLDSRIYLGASEGELTRLIRNHFVELMGEGQFININGRNYNVKKYAQLCARTRQRVIQTRATVDECNRYQNDLVRFSKHLGACPVCQPYEGRVYSLTGRDPKYPLIPIYPPLHPRCQHKISPTSRRAIALQGEVWE